MQILQDDVRMKIRNILNMSSTDRIQVLDLSCFDGKNRITSTIKITPGESTHRFLLTNTKDEVHSLNLFYKLRNASRARNYKSQEVSLGVSDDFGSIKVSKMNIELGLADPLSVRHNKIIQKKENKIPSLQKTFDLDKSVKAQQKLKGSEKLEENTEKSQNNPVEGMTLLLDQMSKLHLQEEKIHQEDQKEMQAIKEHARLLHEEDQMKMQAIQESALVFHEDMKEEMNVLIIEIVVIMVGCMSFAIAVLHRLRL